MTLAELAKLANVSVSTASKAFSGAEDISEKTRSRVLETARATGCYGQFQKNKYDRPVIAIICPETGSAYYTQYLELLQEKISAMHGVAIISTDCFDAQKQAELLEYYASFLKVDGILVFSLKTPLKKGYTVPVISIGAPTAGAQADYVDIDLATPIRETVEILRSLGHRRIAFLGETLTATKQEIFEKSMAEQQLLLPPEYCIIRPERFENAGVCGIRQLLQSGLPCTAAVCAYDYIAMGALQELHRVGVRVPEDFSLIGMDNIRASGYSNLSLTTIDSHPSELCEVVCDLLKKKIRNPYFRIHQRITVSGTLIRRGSIGAAPHE